MMTTKPTGVVMQTDVVAEAAACTVVVAAAVQDDEQLHRHTGDGGGDGDADEVATDYSNEAAAVVVNYEPTVTANVVVHLQQCNLS